MTNQDEMAKKASPEQVVKPTTDEQILALAADHHLPVRFPHEILAFAKALTAVPAQRQDASPEQVAPVVATPLDLRNITKIERFSDQAVAVGFTSCRAAGQFAQELGAMWKAPPTPAPSAETIDTPEFCRLIGKVVESWQGWGNTAAALAALVAHIDARIAAARQEGAALRSTLEQCAIWIENIKPEELEVWRDTKAAEIRRALRSTDKTDGGGAS